MPSIIEVPISLIKAGDIDAIRELLPKPNLFGRWATHPEYGRGIIISAYPSRINSVWFARKTEDPIGRAWEKQIPLDSLTLDPVELITAEDFRNAPVGTIVSCTQVNAYQKIANCKWESPNSTLTNRGMASVSPRKVLRWGCGE